MNSSIDMIIPEGVAAGLSVIMICLVTWSIIIILENLKYKLSKPKSPPIAQYNSENNEPIGFDLNRKDWDAPQWEAPEWQWEANRPLALLKFDDILTTNEIRTMNLEKMIESQMVPHAILSPKGMEVKILRNGYWQDAYLKDLKGEMQTCQRCLDSLTHEHTQAIIKLTDPQIGTIEH